MNGAKALILQARGKLGLTTGQLAAAIGTPLRTVQRWQAGARMPPAAAMLLRLVADGTVDAAGLERAR